MSREEMPALEVKSGAAVALAALEAARDAAAASLPPGAPPLRLSATVVVEGSEVVFEVEANPLEPSFPATPIPTTGGGAGGVDPAIAGGRKARLEALLGTVVTHSAVNVAVAVGHRVGLFEGMAGMAGPASSAEVASACGLVERYVRELLGALVTAGIVDLVSDASDEVELYRLPKEHAEVLTGDAIDGNMAVYTEEIPLLTVEGFDGVVRALKEGGGNSFDLYPRFSSWMGAVSNKKLERTLVDKFVPSVPGGVADALAAGDFRVADVGCGEGAALLLLAKAFPKSTFLGVDIDPSSIKTARASAAAQGLTNLEFLEADASDLKEAAHGELHGSFDWVIAFDSIHDLPRPDAALTGIHLMLKEGGRFSLIDVTAASTHRGNITTPMAPFLYTVSLLYCLTVSMSEGGRGLGMMWGAETARKLIMDAGFGEVSMEKMDAFNTHYFAIKET